MYHSEKKQYKMLDYAQGLRTYGIYSFTDYPDWKILVTDIPEENGKFYLRGLAFTEDGDFYTGVCLRLPLEGKEIDYIHGGDKKLVFSGKGSK